MSTNENFENLEEQLEPSKPIEPPTDEYYNKYLRALADFQNYQKRSRLDVDRAKEEITRKILLDLLPIWDNLELITCNSNSSIFQNLVNQFLQFFSNYNIKIIATLPDDKFDSNIHEAVLYEEKTDINDLIVAEILRDGFILNDKVIRATQIKVFRPKICEIKL